MEPLIAPVKLIGMTLSALVSLCLPIALAIFWRKRTGAKWSAVLVGALTFFVFVYLLESGAHAFFLGAVQENAISRYLNATPWALGLYAGCMAGIFEETGRFLAFKWLLKKQTGRETGVMYGIGHGGIEAILVCTTSLFSMLALAVSLNTSGADALLAQAGASREALQATIDTLVQTDGSYFFAAGIERVIAIALHIALSVLVFAAANRKGKFHLYPVAILLHAAVDCFAVLYKMGLIQNIWFIELGVAVLTVLIAGYARRVYRADRPEPSAAQETDVNEVDAG